MEKPEPARGPKPATEKAVQRDRSGKVRRRTAVVLSSPDKELWPDEGVTKQDLFDHYAAVWPRMKRFVVDRPLALVRAPDGIGGQRFFQKHAMPGMHEAIFKSRGSRRRAKRFSSSVISMALPPSYNSASWKSTSGARQLRPSARLTRSYSTSIRMKVWMCRYPRRHTGRQRQA